MGRREKRRGERKRRGRLADSIQDGLRQMEEGAAPPPPDAKLPLSFAGSYRGLELPAETVPRFDALASRFSLTREQVMLAALVLGAQRGIR